MDSSAGWLILGPGRALALQLADAGFDIWLANSRGNRYSRNHTHLDPNDIPFWSFSWDQMAAYDLPAMVDTALQHNRNKQLVYLGYSQVCIMALDGVLNTCVW